MVEISIQKRPLSGVELDTAQRKYFRKTARGKILKILRERYLRDDIACGSSACQSCQPLHAAFQHEAEQFGLQRKILLDPRGLSNTKLTRRHYLILDTNAFLHQMDLIENPSFTDVIVLQTVIDEVRHRSLPLFNRLKNLIADPDRRFWVFYNDFGSQTAVLQRHDESPNDRNDRAIRTAAKWYRTHLTASTGPGSSTKAELDVLLISDDQDNVSRATTEGIPAMSVRDYIEGLPNADQLLDLLSSRSMVAGAGGSEKRAVLYPEHLPQNQVAAGVKSGQLLQGYFNANPYNYLEATVRSGAFTRPILLVGREAMNRAVDGDVVAVQMLPKDQWKAATEEVIDADAALKNDDAEEGSDAEGANAEAEDQEARLAHKEQLDSEANARSATGEPQPTGKVVGIMRRNWRSYVAHVDVNSVNDSALSSLGAQTVFATPVDRKLPRIRIRTRQAKDLIGQKILVALDAWRPTSRYPDGHFVRALGQAESKEAEQESLLLEHDVPYRPFSKAILDCLPVEGDSWKVPPKDMSHRAWRDRVDLRDEYICSIDPVGCQDIDDALHAKQLPNGNIEAGVHIADVSYFVRPDNPMDAEAASRGTTVYLVDKRIDMLPHLLGTNLCSLRADVERLAFSAIWEMTPDADIVNVRFHKSVIASKAAFTYEEAQNRKDDLSKNDTITQSIRLLNSLAKKLKQKRMDAGALNLASPEVRIHLDSSEQAGPIDVEQKEMRETNSLVEEFMLLANVSVAEKIYETFPMTAVLRRHMPPPRTNFETLQDILLKRRGMELDVSSSGALADSLDKCVDPDEPTFNTLVRIMATRCMLSAEYFCSGSVARDTFAHYGLAAGMYTHFTSPIRRYADVLAHRQLAAAINYEPLHPSLHSKDFVDDILKVVNKRHRSAQQAGRASVEFYVGLSIAERNQSLATATAPASSSSSKSKKSEVESPMLTESAYVIRVFRNGLAVFVNKFGLEGLITFKQEVEFDQENYQIKIPSAVSGLKSDLSLGIFDQCNVSIGVTKDSATKRGKVVMHLID
ncbi:putative DIS3 3`-5` exoribonuclease required for 3` end formation of 5.8S rRNA [Testicularia cyperi]|uniref:Ribosomal RNA-processing protein 44 n=1 Tax=Testicularia cyperi TaxID=1882483 RepID=A0A317XNL1_9BASI|nr:putative DIS3 3`-5` exoribonuclease required for 3` end formation of 5.8S rRNA [Testicularia cyperi]